MDNKQVPLIACVEMGNKGAVLRELESKADVNERDEDGNTAALTAARRNDVGMLHILAQKGANLQATDDFGYSVKFWATKHNNPVMLEMVDKLGQNEVKPFR